MDRLEDDEIRSIARLMKAVGDLPNISYLVAYDRRRVEEALSGNIDGRGAAYLQKVIQLPIPLRPMMDYEVKEFLLTLLPAETIPALFADGKLSDELVNLIVKNIDTPRDVKRLAALYSAIEPTLRGEVNPVDVLGYCLLSILSPELRDLVSEDTDKFVNDPSNIDRLFVRREDKNKSISERVGVEVSLDLERILRFLFPTFGGSRDDARFGRIQQKQHLLTILFLGNPPFRLSRAKTVNVWMNPTTNEFEELFQNGRLHDLIGNLARLLPLEGLGMGTESFVFMANFLAARRGRDAVQAKNVAYTVRDFLMSLGERKRANKAAAKEIYQALAESGDTMLTASVLRSHMFAFGMVPSVSERGGPTFFTRSEIDALIPSEIERYKTLVMSGDWLNSPGEVSTIFAIEQSQSWTPDLRSVAEGQIAEGNNIERFAALFTPPGWSIEEGTVGKFVSEELVISLLQNAKPMDDFHGEAVSNLLRSLRRDADPE
jgi:hypothetical protein